MKMFLLALPLMMVFELHAQTRADGPLGDLYLAKDGKLVQYSSTDPSGGNSDRRPIAPGESLTLVDHSGAGVIRRWWITIAPRNSVEIHRTLIVRCYWDGEKQPSVEVPVADFFGMGFGEWKDYISLPLNMASGGYNSYWPMPFRKSARIEVVNTGTVPIESFYYNIGIRTYETLRVCLEAGFDSEKCQFFDETRRLFEEHTLRYGRKKQRWIIKKVAFAAQSLASKHTLSEDALYFHAQFRKTKTRTGQPVTILETTGRGHYVGTLLSMQPERGKHLGYRSAELTPKPRRR